MRQLLDISIIGGGGVKRTTDYRRLQCDTRRHARPRNVINFARRYENEKNN